MAAKPTTVAEYLDTLPDEARPYAERTREAIRRALPDAEERVRYGMPAFMLDDRHALHFAAWKKHLGLYPIPTLPADLEAEVAPYRTHKDSVRFVYAQPVPYDLIERVARAMAAERD